MIDPKEVKPPQVALLLLLLTMVLNIALQPVRLIPIDYYWFGIALFLAGLGLMIWCKQLFIKGGTPVSHSEQPTKVIKEGPYRFSRNPMYIGGLIMFLGIAIYAGTGPFFFFVIFLTMIIDLVYIPWEEKLMQKQCGEEYERYRKSTRRWL